MVAHRSQLHAVPADWSDEAAVMVEPTACAVHGALAADVQAGELVVVLGSGTLGLLTIAALRRYGRDRTILAVAKHPQQRALAKALGADTVVEPGEVTRAVRRASGSLALGDGDIVRLTGGADHVIDCVGSEASLTQALAMVRPKGRITMVGMPGHVHVDLTGAVAARDHPRRRLRLRHRDAALGRAPPHLRPRLRAGGRRRPRPAGQRHLSPRPATRTPSPTPPTPARGARCKIAFDLRNEKERNLCLDPGFVLDVDRSTPPILFHHGEGFRLERLPAGRSRVIYPAEPIEALKNPDAGHPRRAGEPDRRQRAPRTPC